MHEGPTPSEWVCRWSHLLEPGCAVLDVAGGHGRHARWFAGRGHAVTLVDRSDEAIAHVRATLPAVRVVQADIESGPWPLGQERFGAVVVTNYLWRALMPRILDSVAPGGVLIYETFSLGQEAIGRPSRPEFLLRHGELLGLGESLRVIGFEEGFLPSPDRFVQRLAALRARPADEAPARRISLPDSPPSAR